MPKNDVFKKKKEIPRDLQQSDLQNNDLQKNGLQENDPQNNNLNQLAPNHGWQIYRTRFTVRARTLSAPLSFIDGLGREQSGKIGDYLVESNGVVTITPRRIFEDVYVTLAASSADGRQSTADGTPRKSPISTKKTSFFPATRRRSL